MSLNTELDSYYSVYTTNLIRDSEEKLPFPQDLARQELPVPTNNTLKGLYDDLPLILFTTFK
jgi:hypothetical protein